MKRTFRILCSFVCMLTLVALVLSSCNNGAAPQDTTSSTVTTEDNSPVVTTPEVTTPEVTTPEETTPEETTPEETTPEETTPENDPPSDPLGKQIPVYQGMSISTSLGVTMPSLERQLKNGNVNGNGNTNNNGNHNGWYKGDSVEDQEDVDQNTPFPDADENIDQEIKDSLEVIGSAQDIYYAAQNQNIYIYIYINNPDQFEILSFTLNGQKYSSYMFEKGSNQELLILEYNVGDVSGVVEYTIDQIKYIDGEQIKDVKIGGDRTVKAGVRAEDQVTAGVTDLQIGTNSISFNATIFDKDGLIEYSQGNIKAVLYDGDTLVAEKELSVGSNAVVFDGLKTGTVYQYAIVASYDAFDENGIGLHVLDKYALQTNYVVLFDNIVIGQENISFTFVWDASVTNKSLTGMKLYKDDALVKELNADVLTVSELLSANEYVLVAEYQNLGKIETISLTFGTLAKTVPEISIINPSKTQTSVGFEISVSDSENVGAITKIELVHANGTVEAESLDVRSFADLLSNNTYTVKVTYTYDLNDGNGEQTLIAEENIKTLAKAAPQFVISNEKATSGNITANFTFTDVDSVLSSYKVELYNGETLVAQNAQNVISFTGLEYFIDYTITITYTYDLNDGKGVQTATATKSAKMVSTGFAYTVNSNGKTCTITGIGTCTDTIVVIPDYIDGYKVTAIGENAFANNFNVTLFMIPDTVNTIGNRAFYKCTGITEITLPESVWEIGTQIFQGCNKLTTVYYNCWFYARQNNPFLNTESIETVVFGGLYVPNSAAYGATNIKTVIILEGVIGIDSYAFEGCTSLINVTIPNSVTSIGQKAFAGCSSLTGLVIPNSVMQIDWHAFDGCSSLTSITIPDGVTGIGGYLFYNCSSLTNIKIPKSVKSIGNQAFYNCSSLMEITIPDATTSIGEFAFYNCSSLTSITIPDNVTNIGMGAFYMCSGLTSISIPDGVTIIGNAMFSGCGSLTNITIPDGVTSIGNYAFYNCASLTNFVVPYGITIIDEATFAGCTNLTSITIPNSVTSIGDYAFYGCSSLTSINFEGSVTQWNAISKQEDWDSYSDNYAVYCTDGILCKKHTEIIDEGIAPTCTETGLTEGKHCSVCNEFLVAQEILPATGIHNYERVVVNEPTDTENVVVEYTCSMCGDSYTETIVLTDITITGSSEGLEYSSFETYENFVIPEIFEHDGTWYRVTGIGGWGFNDSRFIGVTIPKSVTSIEKYAFCKSYGLTAIFYDGTKAEWNAINKENFWDDDTGNYTIYCSDGILCKNHKYERIEFTAPSATENGYAEYTCSACGDSYGEVLTLNDFTVTADNRSWIGYTGEMVENLVIPAIFEHDGTWYRVTSIGEKAFYECYSFVSVTIPSTVTSIGDSAFYYCGNLKTVVLAEGVTTIGSAAFCFVALENITIPSTITTIGALAFKGSIFSSFTFPDGVTYIPGDLFVYNSYLTEVVIPDSVTGIDPNAFYWCDSLTTITFKGTVEQWNAIEKNSNGYELTGDYTVYCTDGNICSIHPYEQTVTAPTKFTEGYTTYTCPTCGDTYVGDYVPATGSLGLTYGFNGNGITITGMGTCTDTEVYIPETIDGYTVTAIGSKAFAENSTITFINIPNTINTIGTRAFYKCSEITEITIPESVYDIGMQIFQGCDKLHTVYYNSTYANLQNPFLKVASLENVVFGGKRVPDYILYDNGFVKNVVILDGAQSIGIHSFGYSIGLTNITIPNSVNLIEQSAFTGCISLTNVTIPNSVTSIGNDAFTLCSSLTSITIPDSVIYIGWQAFSGCSSLTSIVLPDSIMEISNSLFYNCSSLTNVTIPDSVASIGNYAFYDCSSLTNITIPDSVTSIGSSAFNGCNSLTSITIPDSVTSIGDYAFLYCNNLPAITFEGTVEQWNLIDLGFCWHNYCTATEVTCSNGSIPLEYTEGV